MSYSTATTAPRPYPPSASSGALRAIARRIDAWFEARKRAAEDLELLAGMSDRDLRDIGIERASVNAVVDGTWMRG